MISTKIKTIIKNYLSAIPEIEFAYLFGSYASGRETPQSDIDIAIYQRNNKTGFDYRMFEFKIESDLVDILPNKKIDVRSFNDAPIIVIGKIINEGELLFYRDENRFHDFIVNNRLKYMDYLIVYNPLFEDRFNQLLNDR